MWGLLAEAWVPVVVHAGHAPVGTDNTGPGPFGSLMARYPDLTGSDFPNLPYPYARQLAGLARLDLGEDWLRAVCWDNPVAMFGLPEAVGGG